MKKDPVSWLMLLLLACIWGGSFILMKRGMETPSGEAIFSDSQVAALRMAIAGIVMLPFGIASLKKIHNPKQVLCLLVVGFCGNFFPAFLFTFAETKLSSGLAGMLNSFTPFFTLLIGYFIFSQALRFRQSIGLLVAFGGITMLVLSDSGISNDGSWLHVGAIVLATVCYAISLNTIKHTLAGFKSWEITSLAFSFVAIPAGLTTWLTGTAETIRTNPHAVYGLGYIAILSLLGTCLALLLFNSIIARTSAVSASSVTYFIPFVAVLFGVFLNQETFGVLQLLAMLIVLSGVYIANSSPAKKVGDQ